MNRRLVALLLLAATIATLAWHAQKVQFFCDDSYISFRYSQNFAAGEGLVYNPGERVEGYTNFLWVVLVGLGMKAGFAAEPFSLWLGLFFLAVALAATFLLARRLFRSDAFALVPCLLLVCQGPMVLWSVSGLEASCFAAFTLLAFLAYERGWSSWRWQLGAGVLYGVSTMVRPDGVVFGAAAGLHLVAAGLLGLSKVSDKGRGIAGLSLRAAALAGGFALAFGPFVLWRHSYYGDWLPNTFYVKAGGLLNVTLGLHYLGHWFAEYALVGSLALVGLVAVFVLPRWREQRRTFAHVAIALALFSGYLAWAGGDYMALYRFMVPLLPLAMLPATALLQTVFEALSRTLCEKVRVPTAASAAAGLLLLAVAGWVLWLPSQKSLAGKEQSKKIATIARMKDNSAEWAALGRALKQKLPPHITIATTAAGALPFFAEMKTIDQSGLCDRHTAKVDSDPWLLDRPGHMKQATRAYLGQRRPEIVFWHPKVEAAGTSADRFPSPPTPDYELRAMGVPELEAAGLCAFFWVRKDAVNLLAPRGVVSAKESAKLVKNATQGLEERGAVVPIARRDKKVEEIEAELAKLDAPPPPEPPTVDPPKPAAYSGPVFATQRIHAVDPASKEDRISVGDVSRPLWIGEGKAPFEVTGGAGSYLELEVASAPVTEGEAEKLEKLIVKKLQGATKPKSATVAAIVDGQRRELPTTLSNPPFAGDRHWSTLRADLGGLPAGAVELEVKVDGQPVGKGSRWLASVPRVCQRAETQPRPNVLIVTIDTLRSDYLGCYGHDRPTSPHLDRLAREGVLFERNVSQASWTLPSYASAFSGQYVESHGVVRHNHPFQHRFVTFLELLAEAGYATGGFVSGTFTDAHWGFDQGFDAYDDLGMVVDESSVKKAETATGAKPTSREGMEAAAHRRITSPEIANRAIAWLDAHRDRRFALFVHFFDPHADYLKHPGLSELFPPRPIPADFPNVVDPKPTVTRMMRALYEGEIAYTDRHVGRLLARLQDLGLDDETIVVVFADHGEAFKEHVLHPDDDARNLGHGGSLFNEQVRVPLIFRVPGIAPGRVASPSGNLDIGPTLLDLCGIDASDWPHQGQSLRPMLEDKNEVRSEPVFSAQFQSPILDQARSDSTPEHFQLAHRLDNDDHCAIEYEPIGSKPAARYLFEGDDRWQDYARNLAARFADVLDRMHDYYVRRRAQLEASRPGVSADGLAEDVLEVLKRTGYVQHQGE